MNQVRKLVAAIVDALPLPDAMGGSRRPVDPRVDREALESFGHDQLAQLGVGQSHMGGAPLPTHYALAHAEAARLELERQPAEAEDGSAEAGLLDDPEDEPDRDACP